MRRSTSASRRASSAGTLGFNWTAIGIEHGGTSDAQVRGNGRQMAASLRLTRMLQGRYRIWTRNVIWHNENRSSPFHRERVERLRGRCRLERPPAPTSLW